MGILRQHNEVGHDGSGDGALEKDLQCWRGQRQWDLLAPALSLS